MFKWFFLTMEPGLLAASFLLVAAKEKKSEKEKLVLPALPGVTQLNDTKKTRF